MIEILVYLEMLIGLIIAEPSLKSGTQSNSIFLKKGSIVGIHFITPVKGVNESNSEKFLKQEYR